MDFPSILHTTLKDKHFSEVSPSTLRIRGQMSRRLFAMHMDKQLTARRGKVSRRIILAGPSNAATAISGIWLTIAIAFFPSSAASQAPILNTVASSQDFATLISNAGAARDRGDRSLAIQLYSQALELNPAWPDGWWFLGTLQYGADQYEPARNSLTHYIELAPPAGPALALRGLCEFEIGKFAESLQDIEQGITHGAANQPRNAEIILYHQALDLTSLGRFEEAIGKYTVLAKQGIVNPEFALAVGLAGMHMPFLPRDVNPANAELIASIGQASIAIMTGETTAAHDAFQSLFTRYPRQQNMHYLFGYLLLSSDPDSAVVEFKRELLVNPQSAVAHAMAAWTLEIQGDFVTALPDAKQAVAEEPSLTLGQLVYGRALVETGDPSAGLSHLESVLQSDSRNLEAHMTLAKALSKLGRSEDARKERLLCLSISDQGVSLRATQ
jgi:tetratricopeptide (TPR) repeat protein